MGQGSSKKMVNGTKIHTKKNSKEQVVDITCPQKYKLVPSDKADGGVGNVRKKTPSDHPAVTKEVSGTSNVVCDCETIIGSGDSEMVNNAVNPSSDDNNKIHESKVAMKEQTPPIEESTTGPANSTANSHTSSKANKYNYTKLKHEFRPAHNIESTEYIPQTLSLSRDFIPIKPTISLVEVEEVVRNVRLDAQEAQEIEDNVDQMIDTATRRQSVPKPYESNRKQSSSSLQHISDRAPLNTGNTVCGNSSVFYSDYHRDETALLASKQLRRRKYRRRVNSNAVIDPLFVAAKHAKHQKLSNSCSTLFVEQTVSQPNLDLILQCSATAIHVTFTKTLVMKEKHKFNPIFDEKLFPLTSQRVPKNYDSQLLSVTSIYDFLRAFFKAAVLTADVAIVTMVYISRLHNTGLVLQPANWKRIVLGAILLASKVWDDQAVWNADYCKVLPDVSVESINQLEREVLVRLFYNVSVSSAEYAQHYFDLRTYCLRADHTEGMVFSPLRVRKAKELNVMLHHQNDGGNGTLPRANSSEMYKSPSSNVIIS
eukprot:CFRG4153T1